MNKGRQVRTLLVLVVVFALGTYLSFPDYEKEVKAWEVKKSHSCIIEGKESFLYVFENGQVRLKIGKEEPFVVSSNDLDVAFSEDGTVWMLDREHVIRWWSSEIIGKEYVLNQIIPRPTEDKPNGYIDDVESLIYDEEEKFVIGYKLISGKSFFVLTQDEMSKVMEWSSDKSVSTPLLRQMSEPDINPAPSPLLPD